MRLTISLLGGIALALVIAAATGSLVYANRDAAFSLITNNGQNQGQALALGTDTPSSTPSATPYSTPTPTPTLRPFYLPSGPGNNDVHYNSDGTQLEIHADAANLEVKDSSNGKGISHVDFYIYDRYGRLVDSHRENSFPFCYFQEDANGECKTWDFAQHGYRWPQGRVVSSGLYFARAIWYNTQQTKLRIGESSFWINLHRETQDSLLNVSLDSDRDGPAKEFVNALDFNADFSDTPSSLITRVSLFIYAPDNTLVYQRDVFAAPYCAFGHFTTSSDCNFWNFAANGDRWPNGKPIERTMYIFRALAYSGTTLVAGDSRAEPIRPSGVVPPPPLNNIPNGNITPGSTTSGNSTSGNLTNANFAILADGARDVSDVYGGMVFRTFAGDNGTDGDNIDHVEMAIYNASGSRVYSRSEVSARFCAFGGNDTCNLMTFAGEGYRWSDGSFMQNGGVYRLQATIYFRNGKAPLTISRNVTIHF